MVILALDDAVSVKERVFCSNALAALDCFLLIGDRAAWKIACARSGKGREVGKSAQHIKPPVPLS